MSPIDKSSPEYLEVLTAAILGLSRYFVGVPTETPPPGGVVLGRDKTDPVYIQVTEGRDGPGPAQRKNYSSCGDQLHAILERLGVRHPSLNRASLGQYRVGGNITLLQRFPFSHVARAHESIQDIHVGSLCLIWTSGTDAHALVLHGPGSAGHEITANYGAGGMNEGTRPGASLADSPMLQDALGFWHIGSTHRQLHSYITPQSLIPYLTGPMDLTGAIVSEDVIEALGARWDHE